MHQRQMKHYYVFHACFAYFFLNTAIMKLWQAHNQNWIGIHCKKVHQSLHLFINKLHSYCSFQCSRRKSWQLFTSIFKKMVTMNSHISSWTLPRLPYNSKGLFICSNFFVEELHSLRMTTQKRIKNGKLIQLVRTLYFSYYQAKLMGVQMNECWN